MVLKKATARPFLSFLISPFLEVFFTNYIFKEINIIVSILIVSMSAYLVNILLWSWILRIQKVSSEKIDLLCYNLKKIF
jgi:hypothetical protein